MSHEVEGDELAQDMIDERNATTELDPLLEQINGIDENAWTKTCGFRNYVSPQEGERPFITTLDWYLRTGEASHAKDRVANRLGLHVQDLKAALKAVLAIPEETYLPTSSKGYFHSGWNAMRGEVRSAIAEALGAKE